MHTHDWLEAVRHALIPDLGHLLAEVNDDWSTDLYATLQTHVHELAFLWHEPEEAFERRLHELGFVRNPVAAWKSLDDGSTEQGSWAWRGRPPATSSTGEWEHDPWADAQLHVIVFGEAGDGTTAAFAHWEYSWKTHPVKHYRGGDTPDGLDDRGVALLRRMFRERVPEYEALASPPNHVAVLDRDDEGDAVTSDRGGDAVAGPERALGRP